MEARGSIEAIGSILLLVLLQCRRFRTVTTTYERTLVRLFDMRRQTDRQQERKHASLCWSTCPKPVSQPALTLAHLPNYSILIFLQYTHVRQGSSSRRVCQILHGTRMHLNSARSLSSENHAKIYTFWTNFSNRFSSL